MAALLLSALAALAAYLITAGLIPRKEAPPAWREAIIPAQRRTRTAGARRALLRSRGPLDRIRWPHALSRRADRALAEAGLSDRLSGNRLLALSLVGALLGGPGWYLLTGDSLAGRAAALAPLTAAVGLVGPWVVIHGRARRRRDEIERALPDVLDLVTVSVEAGLALEAALARVAQRGGSGLHEELRRTLSEIGLGRRRRDALSAFAERTRVAPVRSLVSAMHQAERSGMQLGPVLRAQADQLRRRRRQRAEEAAMKAPLKMLFPLVLFIFPAIFVVLMGPAALQLLQMFGDS